MCDMYIKYDDHGTLFIVPNPRVEVEKVNGVLVMLFAWIVSTLDRSFNL